MDDHIYFGKEASSERRSFAGGGRLAKLALLCSAVAQEY
jgi:hypothetical protein